MLTTAVATTPHAWYSIMTIATVVALAITVIGFKKLVWFMSIGYGLAIMGIGITLAIYGLMNKATIVTLIMCVLLTIYGARLGLFLLVRELKNKDYQKTLSSAGGDKKVPIFVSVFMWIYCALMYICQTAPITYRIVNGDKLSLFSIVGMLIMAIGVAGEALADKQKSAAKAKNPKRFCDEGLFKIVRCPNYFSEILVWTGCIISGIGSVTGVQWILTVIGYVLIVIVMVNGAQRLEKRHEKNYGSDPEYVKYADSTPILFPFVPIYHLNKINRGE